MSDNIFEKVMLNADPPAEDEPKEREYTWVGGVKYVVVWNGEKWELKNQ